MYFQGAGCMDKLVGIIVWEDWQIKSKEQTAGLQETDVDLV